MAIVGNLLPANAESVETDASAWAALVNCATPIQGTGGTLGSFCLLYRSVAAGDVHVGLASRVAVTAGAEYWACASVFPPAVGGQSRIEIRWHSSGGTLIGTDQGPVVTAASQQWHQVGVVGTAPAGAATANVVIRSTATAAAQSWFADRVFLGLTGPANVTGNLLPFNTSSMEVDTSGWSAVGGTLTTSTSSVTWYQSMLFTASAAGEGLVQSVVAPTVTPGVEYAAALSVTPGTAGLTHRLLIQWLDDTDTQVGSTSTDWTPAVGQWSRCTVVDVAPPGATKARVVARPTATATGQQWAYDRALLAPTSALMVAGNLLPYNTSDFEQDVSGWTVTGGTKTQSAEQSLGGAYSMKLVASGGPLVATLVTPVPVEAGLGYEFAPISWQNTTRRYQTLVEWLDASGTALRTRWNTWNARASEWLVSRTGDLAPDGAVSARLSFVVPNADPGEVWYLDRMEWKLGGLTLKGALSGGGGVALTARGLTTGGPSWVWSLTRLIPGQPAQPVRGWNGDLTSQPITGDVAVVTDYEAPLGVPVQWRVIISNPSGVGSYSYTCAPVTLPAEATDVWLKDPGLPQRSVQLTVGTPMPTWRTVARQGVNQVRGRRLPVVLSDVRGGKTGDLTVITETEAEREALDWVLASGSPLLLQWPPGWGERDMYVSVGDVQAAPIVDYAEFHDRTWVLPLTEVDRPVGGVTGNADRTWQTVKDSGTTWASVLADADTWLDIYTGA